MLTSSNSFKEILEDLGHTSEKQFFTSKFKKLNELLVGVIDGFSLVNYQCLDIQDEESICNLMM